MRAVGGTRALPRVVAGMVDRFTSMLDCVDVGFLPDGILDQLPAPSQIGATRVGGVDVNKPAPPPHWPPSSPWPWRPTGSPSPTSLPRCAP